MEDVSLDTIEPTGREPESRVWALSDLQPPSPEAAKDYLGTAFDDMEPVIDAIDQIWYLGDAMCGTDLDANRRIAQYQVDVFERCETPLRYVMGNHDLDYLKETGEFVSPFYDAVDSHSTWKTTRDPRQFYFTDKLGSWTVLFLSDHAHPGNEWVVTHGDVHHDEDQYPFSTEDYQHVVETIAKSNRPVVIAGHNAFPGGNRPAELQRQFFPLPRNVRVHLYGHAHIGDEEWVAENAYRTIAYVDEHRIPQIDIASLEDYRGDTVRSAILSLYSDGRVGVTLRDHRQQSWLESYHRHAYSRDSP